MIHHNLSCASQYIKGCILTMPHQVSYIKPMHTNWKLTQLECEKEGQTFTHCCQSKSLLTMIHNLSTQWVSVQLSSRTAGWALLECSHSNMAVWVEPACECCNSMYLYRIIPQIISPSLSHSKKLMSIYTKYNLYFGMNAPSVQPILTRC